MILVCRPLNALLKARCYFSGFFYYKILIRQVLNFKNNYNTCNFFSDNIR